MKKNKGIYENGIIVSDSFFFWKDLVSWEIKNKTYKIIANTGFIIDYKMNDKNLTIEELLKKNLPIQK
ncbi:MAG: hypothetical protein JXQ65_00690 [Candidatus Marinimicrobia bacterium]|nr:hypothetical protein [Candidatus Neomarinimicrobiota bacterium]